MAHQISVFVENKPGRISKITGALTAEEINIRAMTLSPSGDFGVIKLLVDRPDEAYQALLKTGFSVYKKEILAILMEDRPGGLHALAKALDAQGINIEDAYGFVIESSKKAVFVIEVEQIPEAAKAIAAAGLPTLSDEELYSL